MTPRRLELVADAASPRLDRFLATSGMLPSRALASRLVKVGAVLVNGEPARSSRALNAGDRVSVDLPEPSGGPLPEDMPLNVVYEDDDLMVVDKPAGLVVHPGAGRSSGTLVNALLALHPDWPTAGGANRPGIVHRLDKGTSGLMLVARTDAAHRRLSADLAARRVKRVYLAICRGRLVEAGRIEAPIGRDRRDRKRMAVVESGRAAVTEFRVVEGLRDATLLEVTLGTGRTHQVRVHLAAIGHPLIGDQTYGSTPRSGLRGGPGSRGGGPIERPALHAHRLTFRHPVTGEEMAFESAPPDDFERALAALRAGG
jgi:23S rRNA pseudouridine1911/1915/1917 synthase